MAGLVIVHRFVLLTSPLLFCYGIASISATNHIPIRWQQSNEDRKHTENLTRK